MGVEEDNIRKRLTEVFNPPKPKRKKNPKAKQESMLERLFAVHLDDLGIEYVRQFRFHPTRQFRSDFHIVGTNILIELDGGVFTQQVSHSSIGGVLADMDKQNQAVAQGYRQMRFSSKHVENHSAADLIAEILDREADPDATLPGH